MTIIAHVQGFGENGADINSAAGFKGCFNGGAKNGFHPAQFVDDILAVCAHAQYFSAAFIQVGIALDTVGLVLDHVNQL